MSALNHPEYDKELKKSNYTLAYMKNYNDNVKIEKSRVDKEVEYGLKHYNSDNAEQFNDLVINKNIKESLEQKLKNLNKSLLRPYFARVDFTEYNNINLQKLYIGKISLLRDTDQEMIVIDWRAPIANLYYEGRIGEASFESDESDIKGTIKLKRQYTIENAELKEIYDIDITTNDEFLQAALGSSKDRRLKDIVSTIQAEQNKVIRADLWRPLVVQGAAGGGKTTIALHRIAYLLYNYEKSLSPKNFMIIAPNRFFLSYISDVLPDLGVEDVLQTTFEDFSQNIIGKKIKIKNASEKLSFLITNKDNINNIIKTASFFKSSLNFKTVIDAYIKKIEVDFIPREDFKIADFVLLTHEVISELFVKSYKDLPILQRINEIKKTMINTLKQRKQPIIEEVEINYAIKIREIKEVMKDSAKRREIIIKLLDERDSLIQKIKKTSKTIIKEYFSKYTPLSPQEYYKKLFTDKSMFDVLTSKYLDINSIEYTRIETLEILENKELEIEDLAPLMYIKYLIYGLDEKLTVRHVVIDEAQDFSAFQLFILKMFIGGNSFTILGDLCQGIYSYRGINDWKYVSESIFGVNNYSMLTLEQSYRTTIEIMEAANTVIKFLNNPNLPTSKPVIRHGETVNVIVKCSFKEVAEAIFEKVSRLNPDGFKSAAIICKTIEECKNIKTMLKSYGLNINLIDGNEKNYAGGIVLIPSYLVKGLEFDVVIIANASKEAYSSDPLDVKLLYIAMTRPLHRLYIYSVGEKSEILSQI